MSFKTKILLISLNLFTVGQLTAKGMRQHFELGTKLRKKYIEETGLLPADYHHKSVYVRSTDIDRTLMSAQSLLLGLYPLGSGPNIAHPTIEALPGSFQPIPIHTKEATDEDVLLVHTHSPRFQDNFQKHVKNHKIWVEKNNDLKRHYARWSKATGVEIDDLYHLISLGNTLFVYQSNQVPLPKDLSKKDIDQIIDAGKWAFCFMFKPEPVANAVGRPLLGLVVDHLSKAHESNDLKFVLLSGHDSSLLALFSAMGVALNEPPPYASHLSFSVYQEANKEPYVVISYNDQILEVPACGGSQCQIKQLKALTL